MVQLILNPAYLPIADVSEIGLFGEILPDESIGVLIQPFLPRMVRAAKIGFRLQCFGYFGVLVELFVIRPTSMFFLQNISFLVIMGGVVISQNFYGFSIFCFHYKIFFVDGFYILNLVVFIHKMFF